MDVPRLRPLTVGEVLDVSIKLYLRHFLTLVKVVAVVVAPVAVVASLLTESAISGLTPPDPATVEPTAEFDFPEAGQVVRALAGVLLSAILQALAALISTGAAFRAVSEGYLGRQPVWSESLTFALARIGPLMWLSLLNLALLIPAFFAFLVPGIWLVIAWAVATPVLLFEGVRGRRALGRSFRLVRGRWWPTAAAFFVAYLLTAIVQGVIVAGLFGTAFVGVVDTPVLGPLIDAIGNTLSSVITTPFVAATIAVVYFDLRVRKEGFDLELLAAGLGAPPPPTMDPAWPPSVDPASPPSSGGDQGTVEGEPL